MFLVDSHCHLNLLDLSLYVDEMDQVIERAKARHVHYILNVCTRIKEFQTILETAKRYPFVSASVGLHPNDTSEEVSEDQLLLLAQDDKVVAIGETGLDYFRSTGDLTWQRDRFRTHIHVAKALKKPLIIHTRDASEDTLRVMREEHAHLAGGVMHCFSEDWEVAKAALDMDFYISFSGTVTFKSATTLQEVAKRVPLDRILVETDSPYLAPVPNRGKPNEPGYVYYTAQHIANLRQMPLEEIANQTTDNFFRLFQGATRPHV